MGRSAVCVCVPGCVEAWTSTAAPHSCCQGEISLHSLDCCVRCFSLIHKNAIPCSSVPGLMK